MASETLLKPGYVEKADVSPASIQLKPTKGLDADEVDLEAGGTLFPGISQSENERRWGFVRKVYGIVGAQLALTAAVGSCFALLPAWQLFAVSTPAFMWTAVLAPLIMLIPLFYFRNKHPINLALLAVWTLCMGITTGLACSVYQGVVVAEALLLTGAVVLSLTAYTFYAVKKGQDFSFLGPMLFASLVTVVVWGFLQIVMPPGNFAQFLYPFVSALLFSLYIVYDTDSLIKRFSYDEFVWASLNLYLDILNLFLSLLRILNVINR